MKLNMGALFGPLKKSSKKQKNGTAYSSSSDDSVTSFRHESTPKSVLSGRTISGKASSSGSDDCWPSDLFTSGGRITRRDLEAVLVRLGPNPPTEEEVASMVAEVDCKGDGCISLAAAGDDELRDAFDVFDADGDGRISAEELLGVFLALGDDGCTIDDCRRMIDGVDTDGDGFVCFDDFVRMMDGQR